MAGHLIVPLLLTESVQQNTEHQAAATAARQQLDQQLTTAATILGATVGILILGSVWLASDTR